MTGQRHRRAMLIAWTALALCGFQWIWFSWRIERGERSTIAAISGLKAELGYMQALRSSPGNPETDSLDEAALRRAVEQLSGKDILDRYRAGLTVREFGSRAVPELVELIRSGNSRGRDSAMVLLGQMECDEALPDLRSFVEPFFHPPAGKGPAMSPKTAAALLGLLARKRDGGALYLFKRGLDAPDEEVRAASILGLRRLDAVELLPALASRLGKERKLIDRELEKTVRSFCRSKPDMFQRSVDRLPPPLRFQILKTIGRDPSAASLKVLRHLSADPDPRIALGAAHLLGLRGDKSGKTLADRLSREDAGEEIRRLAEQVLRELDSPPGESGRPADP